MALLWPMRRGNRTVPRSTSGTPNRRQEIPRMASSATKVRIKSPRSYCSRAPAGDAPPGPDVAVQGLGQRPQILRLLLAEAARLARQEGQPVEGDAVGEQRRGAGVRPGRGGAAVAPAPAR